MAEKIILEVDVAGLANKILEAQANVDSYTTALNELTEAYGENSKEVKIAEAQLQASVKTQKQLEGQLLRTTQAQQAFDSSTVELTKDMDFNNNSVDQNRKLYNALYAEYIKTDKAGREKLQPTMEKINKTLKEQESAVGDTRRNVGNYAEGFKSAIGSVIDGIPAFKGFATAQMGVNAAMNANPIGAVVMLFQGLVQIMQNNAEVADQLSFAIEGITKGFRSIVDGVVDTVTNFDKFTKAIQNPIKFLFDLGKNAAQATREGYAAAAAIDDLTEAAAEFGVNADIANTKAQGLTKTLKDKTKSEKERIAIATQIADLEIQAIDNVIKSKQKELEAERQRTKGLKLSGEERAKLRKLEGELEVQQIEKNNAEQLKQTRINILLEKEKTENKKVESKTRQEIEREEQSRLNTIANENARLEKIRIEALQQGLEKETSLYELSFESRIEDLRKAGLTEIQIEELKARELLEIQKKYSEKKIEDVEATNRTIQEQNEKAQKDLVDAADNMAQAEADRTNGILNNMLSFVTDALGQAASLVNAFADQNIEALDRQFQQGLISERDYNQQAYELKVKAFKETKALNITQAVIATLQATLNAFNSGLQAGGPFGIVLGAIFAATAAAFGGAQIALIAKQQPPAPQFAKGGSVFDVGGKSHSEGGTLYTGEDGNRFEVEKGEKIFVMKKTASRHIDALGGLNVAFGGRAWSDSPISYAANGGQISDGGFAIRQTSQEATTMTNMKLFANEIVKGLPNPVVSVNEFERVQKSKNKSVRVAEL